jgi:hypothetical protein
VSCQRFKAYDADDFRDVARLALEILSLVLQVAPSPSPLPPPCLATARAGGTVAR